MTACFSCKESIIVSTILTWRVTNGVIGKTKERQPSCRKKLELAGLKAHVTSSEKVCYHHWGNRSRVIDMKYKIMFKVSNATRRK